MRWRVPAPGREHETVRVAAHSGSRVGGADDLLSEDDQLEADGPAAPESGGGQVGKAADHGLDDREECPGTLRR
jgi:hypothetical protein